MEPSVAQIHFLLALPDTRSSTHINQIVQRMLWFKPSFKKKFSQIEGGWSTSQVLDLMGSPLEVEDSEVPLGSNWGSQAGMTFAMKAGDAVKQWMFQHDDEFYYIWFAQVNYDEEDPWRVTLKKKMERRIAA